MRSAQEKRAALAARLRGGEFTAAPGIFDMISALVADRQGHPALYMTGYGTVASFLGLPDAGLASYTDMVGRAAQMAGATDTPIVADADTGYGGLLNVRHTVRGYEAAGVAAIQLEDQEFPKKCGHTPDRRVIDPGLMVDKIAVAADSREDPDFLIIARTDARAAKGLDDAITRARAYRAAGADVLFVEAPESEDEFRAIGEALDAPLLANMVEGGRSPMLPAARLAELGFCLAIYPAAGFTASAAALEQVYAHIAATGSSIDAPVSMVSVGDMHELLGFDDVWAFERRWAR
ncbi:MAG: isocitrate lyase/PEP mutase family protein [Gammaproteobacteria bacterium]